MKRKYIYLLLGLFFLFVFATYTMYVKKFNPAQFDFDTTVRLQNHTPKKLDSYLSFLSLLGSFEMVSIFLLFAVMFFARKIKSFILFIIYGGAHIIEIFGKSLLNHPGPPYLFFRYDLEFYFPSSYVQTGSSYPSGHSFRSVYLAVILAFFILRSKKLKMSAKLLLVPAIMIGTGIMLYSRISLGEHWTSDVVGGTLLGLGFGWLAVFLIQ